MWQHTVHKHLALLERAARASHALVSAVLGGCMCTTITAAAGRGPSSHSVTTVDIAARPSATASPLRSACRYARRHQWPVTPPSSVTGSTTAQRLTTVLTRRRGATELRCDIYSYVKLAL